MNCSDLKNKIYTYLGFHGAGYDEFAEALIPECLGELERVSRFRYKFETYDTLPEFLNREPYLSFLRGSKGVMLSVTTLGVEVDRELKKLSRTDPVKLVVYDACASAYLEEKADEYEAGLGELSYRFCPGYGGSSVEDVREIFRLLKPEKIGMTLSENCYMLPSKSMAGVLGVGVKKQKNCGSCILLAHCKFRKEGTTCYGSENKS